MSPSECHTGSGARQGLHCVCKREQQRVPQGRERGCVGPRIIACTGQEPPGQTTSTLCRSVLRGITRPVTPAAAGGEWRPGRRSLGQTCAPGRDPRRQREVSGKPSADLSDRNHLWPVWLGGWCVQLSLGGGGYVSWGRKWAASRPVPARQSTGRALKTQGRVARRPGFGPLARGPANTQPRPRGQERHVGTHTCHSFRHDVGV